MIVGVTSVTLGKNLRNNHGSLMGTLCLNTGGNIHLPILFALLQDIDELSTGPEEIEQFKSLTYKLFTSDRISFYRGGKIAVLL